MYAAKKKAEEVQFANIASDKDDINQLFKIACQMVKTNADVLVLVGPLNSLNYVCYIICMCYIYTMLVIFFMRKDHCIVLYYIEKVELI